MYDTSIIFTIFPVLALITNKTLNAKLHTVFLQILFKHLMVWIGGT